MTAKEFEECCFCFFESRVIWVSISRDESLRVCAINIISIGDLTCFPEWLAISMGVVLRRRESSSSNESRGTKICQL